jgi:CHAD domain-containing protein
VPEALAGNGRRSLSLSFAPGFRLPDLPGEELESRVFTATYFDSADRALARSGFVLRRRVENGKSTWALSSQAGSGFLVEISGGPAGPPAELRFLLVGILGGRELEQIAKLRIRRSGLEIRQGSGGLAEVVVDDMALLEGRRVAERFNELRVVLVEGDEDLLSELSGLLVDAGAVPDREGRSLDAVLTRGVEPRREADDSADDQELVAAMLRRQLAEILAHDPGTRLGEDPEELHDMRVATRRARAILRAARPLLEPAWTESLREELAWLADALGALRDEDVFLAHLQGEVATLDPRERRAAKKLVAQVESARQDARGELHEALSSERYQALLRTFESGASSLPFQAVSVDVRDLAKRAFKKLRKQVRSLEADPTDGQIHRARIKGKRARYAAELAEPREPKAARFVKRAKRFQDVTGEHQDGVVAEARLRTLAGEVGGAGSFIAGRLAERERERRAAARAALPKAWRQLEQAGKRAWA